MNYILSLPHLNAALNSMSGILLILGYIFIRRRNISAHRFCMTGAFNASVVFLVSYVIYHTSLAYYFHQGPTKFTGTGLVRPFYFIILITHTILAVLIAPFVLITLRRALRGDFTKHRRLARWVFPARLYVSMTGVIVYLMLYQFYPAR